MGITVKYWDWIWLQTCKWTCIVSTFIITFIIKKNCAAGTTMKHNSQAGWAEQHPQGAWRARITDASTGLWPLLSPGTGAGWWGAQVFYGSCIQGEGDSCSCWAPALTWSDLLQRQACAERCSEAMSGQLSIHYTSSACATVKRKAVWAQSFHSAAMSQAALIALTAV